MTSVVLEYPRKDAKTLIKAALEITQGIKQYHDAGDRVVAKSGLSLSYGEQVIVEVPETQSDDEETMISVETDKDVSTDMLANPQKYKSRFLEQLNLMRGYDVKEVKEIVNQNNPGDSKEVDQADDLRDGRLIMIMLMILWTIYSALKFIENLIA